MQFLVFNEECLVGANHQFASITSLPFVHTARRSYRLGVLVKRSDWWQQMATSAAVEKFVKPSHLEEGEVVTRFPLKHSLADVGCKTAGKSLGDKQPPRGKTVKLPESPDHKQCCWYRSPCESKAQHRRETCGYGNNPRR